MKSLRINEDVSDSRQTEFGFSLLVRIRVVAFFDIIEWSESFLVNFIFCAVEQVKLLHNYIKSFPLQFALSISFEEQLLD